MAYKACDCTCARGHLRKDVDYIPKPRHEDRSNANKKTRKGKKRNEKPLPILVKAGPNSGIGMMMAPNNLAG